jgi:hypothetical protein
MRFVEANPFGRTHKLRDAPDRLLNGPRSSTLFFS